MIDFLASFPGLLAALAALFFLGLGFWGLGRWLRRKGHGDALDRVGGRVAKAQRVTEGLLGPAAGLLTGVGRAISRAPLFGSRHQRDMWDDLHHHAHRRRDKHH